MFCIAVKGIDSEPFNHWKQRCYPSSICKFVDTMQSVIWKSCVCWEMCDTAYSFKAQHENNCASHDVNVS